MNSDSQFCLTNQHRRHATQQEILYSGSVNFRKALLQLAIKSIQSLHAEDASPLHSRQKLSTVRDIIETRFSPINSRLRFHPFIRYRNDRISFFVSIWKRERDVLHNKYLLHGSETKFAIATHSATRTVARMFSIGGPDILKVYKTHWFLVFHVSIWGAWSYVWGLCPPKPPMATELSTTQVPRRNQFLKRIR